MVIDASTYRGVEENQQCGAQGYRRYDNGQVKYAINYVFPRKLVFGDGIGYRNRYQYRDNSRCGSRSQTQFDGK